MPLYKVAVEKSIPFQGKEEYFSNVYTFDVTSGDSLFELETLADRIVDIEVPLFVTSVTFRHVRLWSAGIGPNYMWVSKAIPQPRTGTRAGELVYRECALLISWPLPRRQGLRRTIRRDLRKWLHTGTHHGHSVAGHGTPQTINGLAGVPAYVNDIKEPVAGAFLCAPNGDRPTGPAVAAPYLEHRQFPRGRKEA